MSAAGDSHMYTYEEAQQYAKSNRSAPCLLLNKSWYQNQYNIGYRIEYNRRYSVMLFVFLRTCVRPQERGCQAP